MKLLPCQIWQNLKQNKFVQQPAMSFLDKFKGKTTLLSKQQVGGILGRASSHPNTPPIKNINNSFTVALPNKSSNDKKLKKTGLQNIHKDSPEQSRIQKINPFSVSNPFYLDESERQRDQQMKKDKQMKERLERQRRKREELQQRMAEFDKQNKQKYNNRQWIKLGGLGPNLGGQEWEKKKQMHSKMMKFAEQIRMINFEKLKSVPLMSYSHLTKDSKKDARTRAIQYSRSVPRPTLITGQKIIQNLPRSQSRDEMDELQVLDQNHQKYMNLMKRI